MQWGGAVPFKADMTLRDEDDVAAPAEETARPEQPSVIEHHDSAAPDVQDKWSPRRTVVFVVGVCGLFWILVAWFLFTWH